MLVSLQLSNNYSNINSTYMWIYVVCNMQFIMFEEGKKDDDEQFGVGGESLLQEAKKLEIIANLVMAYLVLLQVYFRSSKGFFVQMQLLQ